VRALTSALLGTTIAGAAGLAYAGGYECRAFTLRRVDVPCLPSTSRPLRVLHLSDVHMVPRQTAKQSWLRGLGDLEPDLLVNTGDNLAHLASVPVVLRTYGELLDVPGVFVMGSNDYFAPVLKNPARYLLPGGSDRRPTGARLPWRDLRDGFCERGWLDLDNCRGELKIGDLRLSFVGVDDPHLEYDDLDAVSGPADPSADLAIGVAHAPYLRVLDSFTCDGCALILAGHTHGGQLRVPGFGALVTNCDLDRGRARGLSRHTAAGMSSWLHVSGGIGTSPYAPIRFCCRPEATLLTLLPTDSAA